MYTEKWGGESVRSVPKEAGTGSGREISVANIASGFSFPGHLGVFNLITTLGPDNDFLAKFSIIRAHGRAP